MGMQPCKALARQGKSQGSKKFYLAFFPNFSGSASHGLNTSKTEGKEVQLGLFLKVSLQRPLGKVEKGGKKIQRSKG